ncbi:MAG: tetratricopeptide repeat protein [Thermodesulfobacteriota bacterium]|nr:tetratricopeptide repeat protein [Thermodesulfobacteriota bacterium]
MSNSFKSLLILCIVGLGLGVLGCAQVTSTTSTQASWDRHMQAGETGSAPEKPSPRTVASLQLTDQGRLFLESGKPDHAIRMYEQALNLDPANGQNYYYLSEAWLMKGNIAQAAEFNRLASIYFEGGSKWMDRVMKQRDRINRIKRR